MNNQELEIKTALQIRKSAGDVYEAIVDSRKMSNYFIAEASGSMEEGKTVKWRFPEFSAEFPVRIGKLAKDKYISFYWGMDGQELIVEIQLVPVKDSTIVTITEKSRKNDEAGIRWLKGNTEGWANFLACLKAYLEYGINLRKGAFDFMSDKS
jgi:uncharacterized protein YndB with AHSA1/START domain